MIMTTRHRNSGNQWATEKGLRSTRRVQPFFIISDFSVGYPRRLTSQQWIRNFEPNLLLATWIQTCCIIWNTMSRRGVSMMWGLSGRGPGVKFSGFLRCFEFDCSDFFGSKRVICIAWLTTCLRSEILR